MAGASPALHGLEDEMAGKIKAVLAGCGGITGAWLKTDSVKKNVEIVGLVDINREAAAKKAAEYGFKTAVIGTDLARVIKEARPEVVFDCTVPEAHCGVTLTALKHGCHVMGEKPMADSMANARKMVAAARKAGRTYAVIQNRRYTPSIQALRKFIASGRIGRVTTVQSDFFIGAHFGGFRDHMKHVLLLDMAIHTFDAARYITGADPKSVYATEWNPEGSWYDHDASAAAIFEMTGGVRYIYHGSWCAQGANTTWECSWRIIGEKGSVLWDGGDNFRAEVTVGKTGFIRKVKEVKVPVREIKRRAHDGVLGEFIDCLRAGNAPQTICTDNIKSLAMVHGAIESATKGKRVTITV